MDLVLGGDGDIPGLEEYRNIPHYVGTVLSHGKATLHEVQTVYSLEDVHTIVELILVDAYNQRVVSKYYETKNAHNH
jgi:hypothetical protein